MKYPSVAVLELSFVRFHTNLLVSLTDGSVQQLPNAVIVIVNLNSGDAQCLDASG